jgi:hypothetical protein
MASCKAGTVRHRGDPVGGAGRPGQRQRNAATRLIIRRSRCTTRLSHRHLDGLALTDFKRPRRFTKRHAHRRLCMAGFATALGSRCSADLVGLDHGQAMATSQSMRASATRGYDVPSGFWMWLTTAAAAASVARTVTHAILNAPRGSALSSAAATSVPSAVPLGVTHSLALLVRTRRGADLLVSAADGGGPGRLRIRLVLRRVVELGGLAGNALRPSGAVDQVTASTPIALNIMT